MFIQGETTLPPVRNSLLKKKKKKKSQIPGNTPRQKPARLSGYDYSAWDKYIAVSLLFFILFFLFLSAPVKF